MDHETEIALLKQKVEHLEEWVKDSLRRIAADKESEKDVRRDQGKRVDDLIKEVALLKQIKDSSKSIWDRVLMIIGFLLAVASIVIQIAKPQ
jgi:hypothetical protein